MRKGLALLLSFLTVFIPAVAAAGPPILGLYGSVSLPPVAPTTLPVVKPGGVVQGVSNFVSDPSKNQLLIQQNQPRAVIDWQSFNIGANAWVHYDQQKNADWIALNRIYDANPSQIYGKLTADGKVYLINRNGILFGPGSQVNVHSMIASSLNLKTIVDDPTHAGFLDPAQGVELRFVDDGSGTGAPGAVANYGTIETDGMGSVFLLGPRVENGGTISTPAGQAGLAAGTDVSLHPDASFGTSRAALVVTVNQDPGDALNFAAGKVIADSGLAGMYGREVRQDGLIRAVTAIKRNGQIELLARDRIVTGAKSVTEIPVSDSDEKFHESFPFAGGDIKLGGLSAGSPAGRIEHHGAITAPSGTVTLNAADRVYLETGSRIDVSGVWVDKLAAENVASAQLTSEVLRDAYGQKDGPLKGATVQFDPLTGSAIGDVSGSLASQELSARERSTAGGTIFLNALAGDILVKQGAGIDFAGGGTRYEQGNREISKLLSGNRVYDIGSAPGTGSYDKVLGDTKRIYGRFGVTEEWKGFYCGGGAPIKNFTNAFVEGSDAGSLSLQARQVVLDGYLNGRAERGIYQTLAADPVDSFGRKKARGLAEPVGGALILGATRDTPESNDQVVNEIVVKAETDPLPADFGPDTPANLATTYLSAKTLNAAGLSRIDLNANRRVTIAEGASVSLRPGAAFAATARRIDHLGEIDVPAGSVTLKTKDNIAATPESGTDSRIFVAGESRIDVSGEKVDNSGAGRGGSPVSAGHTGGGTVTVQDGTDFGQGVILQSGSRIDVNGGYSIDTKGNVTGGDAGTVNLQGAALILDGEIRGLSLPGKNGGKLVLHASKIEVAPTAEPLSPAFSADSLLPDGRKGKLVFATDRMQGSGFSSLELGSRTGVTVAGGTTLAPSVVKMTAPTPGGGSGSLPGNAFRPVGDASDEWYRSPEYLGASSIRLAANASFENANRDFKNNLLPDVGSEAAVDVAAGASIRAGVGGAIALAGPGVTLGGLLDAPAGSIGATATNHDLTIRSGGSILAEGVTLTKPASLTGGTSAGSSSLPGGTIQLAASAGDLVLESGSLLSVSGSPPGPRIVPGGVDTLSIVPVAAEPGAISLASAGKFRLEGTLRGNPMDKGLKGGTLSIRSETVHDPLTVTAEDVRRFGESGFDALTFGSKARLVFAGDADIAAGRSLTLDAPAIEGADGQRISLSAPWIRLVNSALPTDASPAAGTAEMALQGQWIDLEGSLSLSGFGKVDMGARNDIRFSDRLYDRSGTVEYRGELHHAGDLTMKAARIYPTTQSDFTIHAGGKVTTLPGDVPDESPVYSAGGRLAVNAAGGIEHRGVLAAPFGTVSFNEDPSSRSRVFLAEGSVTTTAGDSRVNYGYLNDDQEYRAADKRQTTNSLGVPIEGAPEQSVTMNGSEVVVQQGARIDVSGGGSVFAYQFLPGIEGSANPLTVKGRYVIVPDGSVKGPGDAVYLSGGYGIPEGTYSLLPAEFAFLPGAMVITEVGGTVFPGETRRTSDGFPVVGGYRTVTGTDVKSPVLNGFAVRSAADVLKEGNFTVKTFQSGDAGTVSLQADTTILNGAIAATALEGYRGGTIALSGKNVTVRPTGVSLPADFGFDSAVPPELQGTLFVDSTTLSGKGLHEIRLGAIDAATPANSTVTVTLKSGSTLDAPVVTLAARDAITLEAGSQINAVDQAGGGVAALTTQGKVTVEDTAQVHASDKVALDVREIDFRGANPIRVDHSALSLTGDRIFFVPDGFAEDHPDQVAANPGLYVTGSIWNGLSGFGDIALQSRSDLVFQGDFDLAVGKALTIDAGRIGVRAAEGGTATVSLGAPTIGLLNTGGAPAGPTLAATGVMNVNAGELSVGKGDILFDGLSALNFNSAGDFTLKGTGSLSTGGDLSITSARVTTSNYAKEVLHYEGADFRIHAPNGQVVLRRGTGAPGTTAVPGGALEIDAQRIDQGGVIVVDAGRVALNAGGTLPGDGVLLRSGSEIDARGFERPPTADAQGVSVPAGTVSLKASAGTVTIEKGATVDVSGAGSGDAGTLAVSAPSGGATLMGDLRGMPGPAGGRGGSFALDTDQVQDFSSLNRKLSAGGFTGSIDVRARTGNLTVGAEDTVRAGAVRLAADGGNVDLQGAVDASGSRGGTVEMYAGNDLALRNGSRIAANATAAGEAGGEARFSSAHGVLDMESGSTVDVSGGADAKGGTVSFRAPRTATDVNMNLNGAVTGASEIVAEAFQGYESNAIGASQQAAWLGETRSYMANAGTVRDRLLEGLSAQGANFHFLPGIEVRSAGDLTLSETWDFTPSLDGNSAPVPDTGWRFGTEPGILTLRAAGDLNINAQLVDHPTPIELLNRQSGGRDSWAFNLAAGSDLTAADPLAVTAGAAKLGIAKPSSFVYTESAPIRFASSGATEIGPGTNPRYAISRFASFNYTLATYDAPVRGTTGGDLTITGGAIQSSTGDIDLKVGGNLDLISSGAPGSIRTTGEHPPVEGVDFNTYYRNFWELGNGGDISLDVGGSVAGPARGDNWDAIRTISGIPRWSASYSDPGAFKGIGTMAGGSVDLRSGGAFSSQAGTFGSGDLRILSGGNMSGRFLVKDGNANLVTLGDFGLFQRTGEDGRILQAAVEPVIEAFDANLYVNAQGGIALGTVVNPTIARNGLGDYWNLAYGRDSKVSLNAWTGDVALSGETPHYNVGSELGWKLRILPPKLSIHAGGDVRIANEFALAPSPQGSLFIDAGGDIDGSYTSGVANSAEVLWGRITMSDNDPDKVYGPHSPQGSDAFPTATDFFDARVHHPGLLAERGSGAVSIRAGGDIRNLQLFLPVRADVTAGGEIRDINYVGQNIAADDVSTIRAGKDIFFSSATGVSRAATGIEQGGPGFLVVESGGPIDLGTTKGIQGVGNLFNQGLGTKGSTVIVAAGVDKTLAPEDVKSFFDGLRQAGNDFSELKDKGEAGKAQERIEEARRALIVPFFGGSVNDGGGDINMVSSQISTNSGKDDVFVVAKGTVNVGRSTIVLDREEAQKQLKNTGIYTAKGGAINIFSGGDLNVNEARVMTFQGGDITAWSDRGSINAGRGSKTAISADPPKLVRLNPQDENSPLVPSFNPPAVGSGIRTLTYASGVGEDAPPAGDVYLFAPTGAIDAGEAGIFGNKVVLGATQVINAGNIGFAVASVGVPSTAGSGVSLGALSGAGALAESTKMVEQVASLATEAGKQVQSMEKAVDNFVAKWLDVKVIGFEVEDEGNPAGEGGK
jgi:filamentous hemagglutinin family protein